MSDETEDKIDELFEDFDWGELEEFEEDRERKDGVPIGSDIQRALRDECLKVSPYVKMETGVNTRFDLAMYLPKPMPFIVYDPKYAHCWHKFRRIYCKRIWDEVIEKYKIPRDEIEQRAKELAEKDGVTDERGIYRYTWDLPDYRYKGQEYKNRDGFWQSNAKKELATCDQPNCEWWKGIQEKEREDREEYGFMNGLHLFEIKSDKDKHDLLIHQIPNMIAIADYVWLVLGENQPKPEWLPPYISVLRYNDGKFTIEHKNDSPIKQPPMYWHSMKAQGYKIENQEEYAFARLMRKWRINSMFHFMFEGQVIIDMQDDIEKLLSFLRRADKNKTKQDYERFQRNLFNYIPHEGDGSGNDGI